MSPVVVIRSTRIESGVELRWGFGDPARVASTTAERRRVPDSAWLPLALTTRTESGSEVALDAGASDAHEYDYRLRVRLNSGE